MKKLGRELLQNKSRIKGKEIKNKIVNHGGMMSRIYIYIYTLQKHPHLQFPNGCFADCCEKRNKHKIVEKKK